MKYIYATTDTGVYRDWPPSDLGAVPLVELAGAGWFEAHSSVSEVEAVDLKIVHGKRILREPQECYWKIIHLRSRLELHEKERFGALKGEHLRKSLNLMQVTLGHQV